MTSSLIMVTLIAIGSNLDNTGVGIAYGVKKIRFPHWVNALINAIGLLATVVGAYAGFFIERFVSASAAGWVALIALSSIAMSMLYSSYVKPREQGDREPSHTGPLGLRQGVLLGISLSVTNLTSSFSASVTSANSFWLIVTGMFVWGYLMIWIGNAIGRGVMSKILGRHSALVSSLLLVFVGLHQIHGY